MSLPPPLPSGDRNSASNLPGVPGRSLETANHTVRDTDSIVAPTPSPTVSSAPSPTVSSAPSPTVSSASLASSQPTSTSSQDTIISGQSSGTPSSATTSTTSSSAPTSTTGQNIEARVEPSTSAANSTTTANPSSINPSNDKSDEEKKKKMNDAVDEAGTPGRAKRTRSVINTAKAAEQISGEFNERNIIYNTADTAGKRMTRAVKAQSETDKHGPESISASPSQTRTMPARIVIRLMARNMLSNVNRGPARKPSKRKRSGKPVDGKTTNEQTPPQAKRQKTKARSLQPAKVKKVVPCGDAQHIWLKFQSKEIQDQASWKDLSGQSSQLKNDKYVAKSVMGKDVLVPVGSTYETHEIKNPNPLSAKEQGGRQKTFTFKVYFRPEFGRFFSQGQVEYVLYKLETTSHKNLELMEKIKVAQAEAKEKGEKLWFGTMEDF